MNNLVYDKKSNLVDEERDIYGVHINMDQDSPGGRYVEVVNAHFIPDHFQNAVFERSSSIVVFNSDQVILCALDVHHKVLVLSLIPAVLRDVSCELKYFLLGDGDSIGMVKTTQLDVLVSVIVVINLIEDLPSDIELNSLPDDFQLVSIL